MMGLCVLLRDTCIQYSGNVTYYHEPLNVNRRLTGLDVHQTREVYRRHVAGSYMKAM